MFKVFKVSQVPLVLLAFKDHLALLDQQALVLPDQRVQLGHKELADLVPLVPLVL